MSRAEINDTSSFYTGDAPSLFWEMTVCQSLADRKAPHAKALARPDTYGGLLAEFIGARLTLGPDSSVAEIGGGYGTLMKELSSRLEFGPLTMVDISPNFSERQRQLLGGRDKTSFVVSDVFDWLRESRGTIDLVIANEIIGDFHTVYGLDAAKVRERAKRGGPFGPEPIDRVARLALEYKLPIPGSGPLSFNLGALEFVESLGGRARAAFISEHSANAAPPPPYDFLVTEPTGMPSRIELKDHAEYTISFDHLETVAAKVGFKVERLPMVELLGVRSDEGARFMAAAECVGNEAAEAVHEFLNHVKDYECVLLTS